MAGTSTSSGNNKLLVYFALGVLALGAATLLLVLLYFGLSYAALNVFLSIDRSAYGLAGGEPGYMLLGLPLGAAGGMLAAQRRFRLHRGLGYGAAALLLGALGVAAWPQPTGPALTAPLAAPAYVARPGRVSCAACTVIAASTTRPAQHANAYEAPNLLRRDSTKAWVSGSAVDAENPLLPAVQLQLVVAPLAGHRLVGLRLRNGYCKNAGVYQGFGRVQTCRLRQADGQEQAWLLPDAAHREYLLPVAAGPADTTRLTFRVESSYPGETHPEVALAWLVPVFDLAPKRK